MSCALAASTALISRSSLAHPLSPPSSLLPMSLRKRSVLHRLQSISKARRSSRVVAQNGIEDWQRAQQDGRAGELALVGPACWNKVISPRRRFLVCSYAVSTFLEVVHRQNRFHVFSGASQLSLYIKGTAGWSLTAISLPASSRCRFYLARLRIKKIHPY